jgi:hypothetical protein
VTKSTGWGGDTLHGGTVIVPVLYIPRNSFNGIFNDDRLENWELKSSANDYAKL